MFVGRFKESEWDPMCSLKEMRCQDWKADVFAQDGLSRSGRSEPSDFNITRFVPLCSRTASVVCRLIFASVSRFIFISPLTLSKHFNGEFIMTFRLWLNGLLNRLTSNRLAERQICWFVFCKLTWLIFRPRHRFSSLRFIVVFSVPQRRDSTSNKPWPLPSKSFSSHVSSHLYVI
jgi:hypothetical protein